MNLIWKWIKDIVWSHIAPFITKIIIYVTIGPLELFFPSTKGLTQVFIQTFDEVFEFLNSIPFPFG